MRLAVSTPLLASVTLSIGLTACILNSSGTGVGTTSGTGGAPAGSSAASGGAAPGTGGASSASSSGMGGGASGTGGASSASSSGTGGAASSSSSSSASSSSGTPVGYSLRMTRAQKTYVEATTVAIPQDFTIETWIKPTALGSNLERVLIAKDKSGQSANQFRLVLESGGNVAFLMSNSGSKDGGLYNGGYKLRSTSVLQVGTWAHVAVTKDGMAFNLLVNGVVESSFTASANLQHGGPQPFRLGARVGADGSAADNGYDGLLDEVRIFNGARTQAQIAGAMHTTLNTGDAGFSALVASYRLDEGTGTEAADQTGTHKGTLVNNPMWAAEDAVP